MTQHPGLIERLRWAANNVRGVRNNDCADWLGGWEIMAMEEAADAIAELVEALGAVHAVVTDAPELNMNNYDEDDVSTLNDAMIETHRMLSAILAKHLMKSGQAASCHQRRIPMENDMTRDDRARIDALAHAVRRPASTEMPADQIVADAEKFYNFLIGKS